jgi:hypothetical protein
MDADRFDGLSRHFATRRSRRLALTALLSGALVPSGAAAVFTSGAKKKRKGKGNKRPANVAVCHSGETLWVPREAVRGVLLDDGSLGPCPPGSGGCISVDQICNPFPNNTPCCNNSGCSPTAAPGIATCQTTCTSDQDCADKLGTSDLRCIADILACPFRPKCCRPKICTSNSDCPINALCCRDRNSFTGLCCLGGQRCRAGIGCQDT